MVHIAPAFGEDDSKVGRTYDLPFLQLVDETGEMTVCDTYVTLTDGTGVVHIAPAFGEDDSKVGRTYDLPFLQLVDETGEMTKETKWAGNFCKKADPEVLKYLAE